MSDIKEWSESFTEEVYKEWRKNYSNFETGIKTFYTPVGEDSELIIISYDLDEDKNSFQKDKERSKTATSAIQKKANY